MSGKSSAGRAVVIMGKKILRKHKRKKKSMRIFLGSTEERVLPH